MSDVVNELSEKTALPPGSVRRVMEAFAGLTEGLEHGDRLTISRGMALVCRHRQTEGGEPRRVLMLRKRTKPAEGPEGAA